MVTLLWHLTKLSSNRAMCMNSYAKYYSVANLELKLCDHIHMYTSHNIENTCLILCSYPSCYQNSTNPSRHGLHKTTVGVLWYLAPTQCSKSFISCKLGGGECMVLDLFFPAHPTDAQYDWDLGNLEAKSTLYYVPQIIPEQFLQCDRRYYSADKGHCY